MSEEAQEPTPPRRTRKPAKKPGAQTRPRSKAKDAATSETVVSPRASSSSVPEVPAQGGISRRASAWRLGLLTTTLGLLIGGLAWFSDVPELSPSEPAEIAFLPPATSDTPPTSLPQPSRTLEEELRVATLALDIRESRESLMRLQEEARSLASSIGNLASGVDTLKSDVEAVRADTAASLARMEDRMSSVEVAISPAPIPLGDPALRQVQLLGDPNLRIADAGAALQPETTAGLPDIQASPQASVKVSFAKPKPRARAPKPISGWLVHSVRDDLALVEGNGLHYEVREGELLPDAGIVRSIKKRGDKWVVLTNKGVIIEPN
jgi:hypothetical protein